ncbi:MAG: cell division protein ZapE, partial [Methylococcaceae bacterium]|nr:cell division protein ZapE [Methylococcaceae bacterium]
VLVITSNRHPKDLYQGGLQKDQSLAFTQLLETEATIIELVAKTDYRLSYTPALKTTYYFPLDAHSNDFIQQSYNGLTQFATKQSGVLQLLGRQIFLSAVYNNIALLSFDELCTQPLGSADYLTIANQFNTLIITDIPKLTADKRNEAKRFVTLIDALYEHKVQLICTAEVPAHALYTEGDGAFEFKRTVSRLIEMQSECYLKRFSVCTD